MAIKMTKEQMAKWKSFASNPEKQKAYAKKIKAEQETAALQAKANATAPKAAAKTAAPKASAASEADKIRAMFAGRKLNVRDMEAEAKQREDGGVAWKKLDPGEHRVRFLPPVQDTGRLATLVVQCWFDDPDSDEEKRKAYYSPRCSDPAAYCPVTAAYKALLNHPDEDMRKLASKIRPEKFYLANVLLFDAAARTWNNEVLYMSSALYKDVARKQIALVDPEDVAEGGVINSLGIADPFKNRVMVIKREGAQLKTKWDVGITDKSLACTLDQLEGRVDLDAMTKTGADERLLEELVCNAVGVSSISELLAPKASAAAPKAARARAPKVSAAPEVEADDDFVIGDDDGEFTASDLGEELIDTEPVEEEDAVVTEDDDVFDFGDDA